MSASNPLGPWTPWDFQGEPLGHREHQRRTIRLRRRPDGVFLARFFDILTATPYRFIGETRELAEQHAVEFIDDHLVSRERHELVMADANSRAELELERVHRELERRRLSGE